LQISIFGVEIFSIPDESTIFIYKLKKDIEKSRKIEFASETFQSRTIFRSFQKMLNKDGDLKAISSSQKWGESSDFQKLFPFKGFQLSTLKGLKNGGMEINFIILDDKKVYVSTLPFSDKNLNNDYGVVLKLYENRDIKKFSEIFRTLKKRANLVKY
jgi:hypothetical protein